MMVRSRRKAMAMAMGCCLMASGAAPAGDAGRPDVAAFLEEVRTLVEKHYPRAEITVRSQGLHFEFNTRQYMIHEPLMTGEWQDAHAEPGPQKGGIYGDLELHGGEYEGQAVAPQAFDKRYFTLLLLAPYSKGLDSHLYVHLKYPRDVPREFREEFVRLVQGFERHVPARGGHGKAEPRPEADSR